MFAAFNSRIPALGSITRFCLLTALLFVAGSVAQAATTFTVTKTADTNDGFCDADCSLREAITAANTTPGKDTIAFSIGSGAQTIVPLSKLPNITESVVIDGTTQPGFAGSPLIEIDGSSAGTNVIGLRLMGDSITVRGLVINRFSTGYGIEVGGTGHHVIAGNFIGTDLTGTIALGNFSGVGVSSPNNIIGGTTAADRNIISGNESNSGIGISGPAAVANLIQGNYIGTDVTGTVNLYNNIGIYIISNCNNNTIGGATPGAGNLISGNDTGITIATFGNKVQGNYIGTKVDGASALANTRGLDISDNGHDNTIGGTGAGEGNVIAFNNSFGVVIRNGSKQNAILGNSIFSNNGLGIDLGASGVTPNDQLDVDTGAQSANENQNYPVISTITPNGNNTNIIGTFNSVANTQFRIEFFSSPTADATGFGEGKTFLGFISVQTDGNGDAGLNFSVPTASIIGPFITATATDPLNNTSEFSKSMSMGGPGTLQFTSATYNVGENQGIATITVTRIGGTAGPVSTQYSTSNGGTATAGLDYTVTSGVLSWSDGENANKTFTIPIINDTLGELNEGVNITLSNPTGGATLGNANATLIISDDDPPPTLSINDVSQAEGNAGTSIFTFTVTLSVSSNQTITANYETSDDTASAGSDYQPANGLIIFSPGETSKPITVTVNGDTQSESNENFFVFLSSVKAPVGKGIGTGTIVNDDNVQPATLQFSQASSSVQEDLGAIVIAVTRTGDTSAAASVDYKTVNGSASQKSDFEYAAGTLNFAPGETSKTLQLLINEDMYVEGVESFTIALSNPAGASLGAQNTTTVNITDDAPEAITNPIDDPQSFVYMQYHDFLNREPDAAGLNFWTSQITSCGGNQGCVAEKRVTVSAAFFLSIEFQETGFLVERLYKASYGNIPGTPVPVTLNEFVPDSRAISQDVIVNQAGWQQKLTANKQAFVTAFVQRTRFLNAYPTSMTPTQFVDALFANTGVVPSAATRQAVISRFGGASNTTDINARVSAILDVVQDSNVVQSETNRAFVLMEYFGYLRRNPNDAPELGLNFSGYNFWLNKLNAFGGNFQDAEMVKAFITSFEYIQRFGP